MFDGPFLFLIIYIEFFFSLYTEQLFINGSNFRLHCVDVRDDSVVFLCSKMINFYKCGINLIFFRWKDDLAGEFCQRIVA